MFRPCSNRAWRWTGFGAEREGPKRIIFAPSGVSEARRGGVGASPREGSGTHPVLSALSEQLCLLRWPGYLTQVSEVMH